MQLNLCAKSFESRDGTDQALGIEIFDRTGFRHDVPISKVGGEIRKAIENTLKEALAIPMDEGHRTDILSHFAQSGLMTRATKFIKI